MTNNATPTIAGISDAAVGSSVTVTVAGQTLVTTVQTGGVWSVSPAALANGTFTVTVSVTDLAGNTGTATQALTVAVPAIPTPTPTPAVTVIVDVPVVAADVLPSDLATTGVDLSVGWFALLLLALGALGLGVRASGRRAARLKSR